MGFQPVVWVSCASPIMPRRPKLRCVLITGGLLLWAQKEGSGLSAASMATQSFTSPQGSFIVGFYNYPPIGVVLIWEGTLAFWKCVGAVLVVLGPLVLRSWVWGGA
jgi:hypothetical protein